MNVIIIGNGVSGITAAIKIRQNSNYKITVISQESKYFYSRTALMYIYMGQMQLKDTQPYENWFWDKNDIKLLQHSVKKIDFDNKIIQFENNDSTILYDILIIATGSLPNKYNCIRNELNGVRSLYHLQDLDYIESLSKNIKNAVIVGGGLIGVELAEMLQSRNISVTFLVKDSAFWRKSLPEQEAKMINNHLIDHQIDLRLNTELKEIIGNKGNVIGVETKSNEFIPCEFVGITIGVRPNIEFIKNTKLEYNQGVLVDDFLQTNIPNVYAIGDCAEIRNPNFGRKPIEAVWYTAKMMGEIVAKTICGYPTAYQPGIWYNSAKFFELEYQTYGSISTVANTEIESLFWMDESQKKSIRIDYSKVNQNVLGFNLIGIRYRQNVCENWIKHRISIEYVINNLKEANFDPEFFKKYESHIKQLFIEKQKNGNYK